MDLSASRISTGISQFRNELSLQRNHFQTVSVQTATASPRKFRLNHPESIPKMPNPSSPHLPRQPPPSPLTEFPSFDDDDEDEPQSPPSEPETSSPRPKRIIQLPSSPPMSYKEYVARSEARLRATHGPNFESRCIKATNKLREMYNTGRVEETATKPTPLVEGERKLGWQNNFLDETTSELVHSKNGNDNSEPVLVISAINIKKGPRLDQNGGMVSMNKSKGRGGGPYYAKSKPVAIKSSQLAPPERRQSTTTGWNSSVRAPPPPYFTESLASYEAKINAAGAYFNPTGRHQY